MIYKNKRELLSRVIRSSDVVLDVGFWGQGVDVKNTNWPHAILKEKAKEVYGVDLEVGEEFLKDTVHYKKGPAEEIRFNTVFDIVFAGDLVEHLVNPGLFLEGVQKMLAQNGRLILTTPNTFNPFNLSEKLTKHDPTVNPDHTFYFNPKVITVLLAKCGFEVESIDYLYSLDVQHTESWKKKVLNFLYSILSKWTEKYMETMVVTARVKR